MAKITHKLRDHNFSVVDSDSVPIEVGQEGGIPQNFGLGAREHGAELENAVPVGMHAVFRSFHGLDGLKLKHTRLLKRLWTRTRTRGKRKKQKGK